MYYVYTKRTYIFTLTEDLQKKQRIISEEDLFLGKDLNAIYTYRVSVTKLAGLITVYKVQDRDEIILKQEGKEILIKGPAAKIAIKERYHKIKIFENFKQELSETNKIEIKGLNRFLLVLMEFLSVILIPTSILYLLSMVLTNTTTSFLRKPEDMLIIFFGIFILPLIIRL